MMFAQKKTKKTQLSDTLAFGPAAGRKKGEPSSKDRVRLMAKRRTKPTTIKENVKNSSSSRSSSSTALSPSSPHSSWKNNVPSSKLDKRRTNNPFATSSHRERSKFAQAYADGAVPCRIDHGGVNHHLQWDIPPQELDYQQMLPIFAHGLAETRHPYVFVAQHGFTQLLTCPEAPGKVVAVLPLIVKPLRAALASKDKEVTKNALHACQLLSNVVKGALNPFLPHLLIPIKRRCFDRSFQETITELLGAIEENGGEPALVAIKKKVPTYQSVFAF